jgi:glucosamine--fructose-6-phosphate aminotransferase (isomerizing)
MMTHGFVAMIDERFPTVCLTTKDMTYEKTLSRMQGIKSRNGRGLAIAAEGDDNIAAIADEVIYTPANLDFLQPISVAVPCNFSPITWLWSAAVISTSHAI